MHIIDPVLSVVIAWLLLSAVSLAVLLVVHASEQSRENSEKRDPKRRAGDSRSVRPQGPTETARGR